LSYSGNLLVENRNGLIVQSQVWEATGVAERYAALQMLQAIPGDGRVTVGGDKGFDTAEFVRECRHPHVLASPPIYASRWASIEALVASEDTTPRTHAVGTVALRLRPKTQGSPAERENSFAKQHRCSAAC